MLITEQQQWVGTLNQTLIAINSVSKAMKSGSFISNGANDVKVKTA